MLILHSGSGYAGHDAGAVKNARELVGGAFLDAFLMHARAGKIDERSSGLKQTKIVAAYLPIGPVIGLIMRSRSRW